MIGPFFIDGPLTGAAFLPNAKHRLAPAVDRRDIFIMGNLAAHKVAGVAEALAAVGASALCLPTYAPDLNPIEQVFSTRKALLRKAAERSIPGF